MSKRFTLKPIRQSRQTNGNKAEAEQEVVNLYKNSQNMPEIQRPTYHHGIWLIAALLSILGGFSSSLIYDFLFFKEYEGGEQKVIIAKQEDITVTAEERLEEIQAQINPVIVNFYNNSAEVNGPFYQDMYSFGSGFILTSDGWIVTTREVLNQIGDKNYVILTAEYKIYSAEKVLSDPATSVVFIKINARDLPVAKLGKASALNSGQTVYSFLASYPHPRAASLHIADLAYTDLEDVVASSEKINHYLSCREGYDPSLIGSPIVNLSGEIVAVVNNAAMATPMSYLDVIIRQLGKTDQLKRADLGVHYINLAHYPKIDPAMGQALSRGALLSGFKNLTAVRKNSPADQAGLKVGDTITRVEDELVNGRKFLSQMIQEYEPGQTLKLTISRGDKERVVEVKLGSYVK